MSSWHKDDYLAWAKEHWLLLSIAGAVLFGFILGKVL